MNINFRYGDGHGDGIAYGDDFSRLSEDGYGFSCVFGCSYGLSYIDGHGYGFGDSYGDGNYGHGSGYGNGYGVVCEYDISPGYGYSHRNGNGYGDGVQDGYSVGRYPGHKYVLEIPESNAWVAYHYIKQISDDEFKLNHNNKIVKIGEIIYEKDIKLCECGLHASLSIKDANILKKYIENTDNIVLTKVLVWGKMTVSFDKLVATHRKIIEVIK